MRQVFTPVQPIPGQSHPREGQAGIVFSVPGDPQDPTIGVRWDTDQAVTVEPIAGLRQLGQA